MAVIPYDEPITKNTDWGGDSSTGGRPVAGGRVQDFLKGSLQDLDDRISNISGLGRFLSGWDCTTGLAVTNPKVNTYPYPDGAFFIVAKVGATNYRPSGDKYVVGSASTAVETGNVKVGDVYKYDGTSWLLINLETQVIPAFSDETAGTIRGKAQDGYITAENGYGKVQGWQDATQETRGLMTATDKTKLDGIEAGANKTVVDASLNNNSTNPVQNKAVTTALGEKAPIESPAFTGEPTAPTPDKNDRSKKIANTEYVNARLGDFGYNESEYSYGVYHEDAVSTPECTRVGNMDLHKTLPIHSMIRGCLLDDDGNVVKYLDPDDWTEETRDGSQGQVMMEIPAHYRRFNYENNRFEVRLSEKALLGYHLVPKMYISAYEATLDRETMKLASVVNDTAQYRGGNNQSSWDGTYRSMLGMPLTNKNLAAFRNYARNRKEGSTKWNCYTYEAHKALFWLFVVEYATLNSQAEFNPEKTADGYRQGGLGAGVTNLNSTKWNTFNSYYPVIPCGYTDSLGNGTGVVAYEMPSEYDADGITTYVPRYRGVENPFGHLLKYADGILIKNLNVYTCKDPAVFSSTSVDGYNNVGKTKVGQGSYIKAIIGGEDGDIMASVIGGSSNTYFCDALYFMSISLAGVLFGGRAHVGADAGFVFAHANSAPSSANANFASRLCFHP